MFQICYIYEDEDKALKIKNEIERNFGTAKQTMWSTTRKHLYYGGTIFVFLKYPMGESMRGSKFYKIYIEPALQEKMSAEQLRKIAYMQCDYFLPTEMTRMDINQAINSKADKLISDIDTRNYGETSRFNGYWNEGVFGD